MAHYRLLRVRDQQQYEADALNDAEALARFEGELRMKLSLEGPAAPDYILERVQANQDRPNWGRPAGIDVFEVGPMVD